MAAKSAWADPDHPSATEQARAHKLFEQSQSLEHAGEYAEAEALLGRAWSLQHSADVAGDRGICLAKLHRYAESARSLAYASSHMPASAPDATRAQIKRALDIVEGHVGRVALSVKPAEADLSVDGKGVGTAAQLDGMLYLDPGEHTVQASAAGFESASETVHATKGSKQALTLDLAKSAAPHAHAAGSGVGSMPGSGLASTSTPPGPTKVAPSLPPDTTKPPLWPAWVGGSVAVVGLGVGIGFTLAAGSKQSDADSLESALSKNGGAAACDDPVNASRCAQLHDDLGSVGTDRNLALGGFIAAGVGAAFDVGYLVWRGSRPASSAQGVAVRPDLAFAPGQVRLSLGGSF